MKRLPCSLLALLAFFPGALPVSAAGDAKAELSALVEKISAGLGKGEHSKEALAADVQGFDVLLAAHPGEKSDDVAQILLMKATFTAEVCEDDPGAIALLKQLQTDFPATETAKKTPGLLASIEAQAAVKAVKRSLVPGVPFPNFEAKDLSGAPVSVTGEKGKVLLVDFWATWCGPCVGELPNVMKAYEKYHGKGMDILSVSLDQEQATLTAFIKEKSIPWPQVFDGEGKLAGKYGIASIPSTFLLDREGKIIATDLRGADLENALAKALP